MNLESLTHLNDKQSKNKLFINFMKQNIEQS